MVEAICLEIKLRSSEFKAINTVYFGGGTPSILEMPHLEKIFKTLNPYLESNQIEITLEANPDDITKEKLQDWKDLGVNRLSIGIQSFKEEHLLWMNRSHNAEQAFKCLELVANIGFMNSNLDLIYGFEGLSNVQWNENLQIVKDTGFNHLSAYSLTVEEKTPFSKMSKTQKITNDDLAWSHFKYLHNWAIDNNWQHYEISNLCRNNSISKHNTAYWTGIPYIGIGPGAHSYLDGKIRKWNIKDNWKYIDIINDKKVPNSIEELTEKDIFNEKIMLGLRTSNGVGLELVNDIMKNKTHVIHQFIDNGLVFVANDALKLSLDGWWKSDAIAASLFKV